MGESGQIRIIGFSGTGYVGAYDPQTNTLRQMSLVDLNALQLQQGYFIPRDLERYQNDLRSTEDADTSEMRERVARSADDQVTTEARETAADSAEATGAENQPQAPEAYTRLHRYTEATNDSEVREGYRGERVSALQRRLVDQGYLEGGDAAVDGYFGPNTQAAHQRYLADQRAINNGETPSALAPGSNERDAGGETRERGGRETRLPESRETRRAAGHEERAGQEDRQTDRTGGREQPAERTTYRRVEDPRHAARDLVRDARAGDHQAITEQLTNTRNEDMRQIDRNMPRQNGRYTTRLANVPGSDSDYADFANRALRGNRNEGVDARASSAQTQDMLEQILAARVSPMAREVGWTGNIGGRWNGTDEAAFTRIFTRASGAQLAAIDQQIRRGVRDENGDMVRFSDGLAGLVRSEIGAGAHRDALLAQLNRPLR